MNNRIKLGSKRCLALSPRAGFALIATISVMVLLVMVALAMLSLATIETRNRVTTTAHDEAQMNARLALMSAIAELQKAAGQDQRMTMTADFAGRGDGTALPSGAQPQNDTSYDGSSKGLTAVHAGTRHWLGVWRSRSQNPEMDIFTKTPTAAHYRWLISGMEVQNGMTPDATNHALGSGGTPRDEEKTAVLVGENTVGPASGSTIHNYVSAPLVPIEGSGANSGRTTGRYAWWIGDEGVKSRINLSVDYTKATDATYAMLAASRRGWEMVDGFSSYPEPGNAQNMLDRVISQPVLGLVDRGYAAPAINGSPLQRTFHAATPYSMGLLTNALSGGLKVDLTRYLEEGFPASFPSNFVNPPLAGNNIVPRSIAPNLKGPMWRQLKAFYDLGKNVGGATNPVLTVQTATSGAEITIAPVISDIRFLMGAWTPRHSGTVYRVFPCAKVAIALANPYPYPLKWETALELEIKSDTPGGNRPSCIWEAPGQPAYLPIHTNHPAVFNKAIFRIEPGTLPPGEARAYTMASQVRRPYNTNRITIDLKPFGSSDPSNFEKCIVMETPWGLNLASGSRRFDCRESWTTSLLSAELKLAGSSTLLRRLSRFELDNGYFAATSRFISNYWASRITKPFPLQLYSYQVSQPGADYGNILPTYGGNQMGLRSSTMRTFADFNLQATYFEKPISSYDPPPYFTESMNSLAHLPFSPPGGQTGSAFTRNLAVSPLPWGRSAFGPEKTILFSPPKQMVSLAQFQHADLTADDVRLSVGHQPGNAVGNSYATPFVRRELVKQQRTDYTVLGTPNPSGSIQTPRNYYDMAYLLNAALWDKYFLSTIPTSGLGEPENKSIIRFSKSASNSELHDGLKAAGHLAVNGAFNVNSTNKDAWIALIASTQSLKHPADTASRDGAMFPRSLEQTSPSTQGPSGDSEDSWSGYRRLSKAEIDVLAEEIVKQVRLRGPFTSMAHFVNRALRPLTDDRETGRSGPLQSAIDWAGLTIKPDGSATAFTDVDIPEDQLNLQRLGRYPRGDLDGGRGTWQPNGGNEPVWAPRSRDLNPGAVASILADRPMLLDNMYRPEQGYRSTGIPGWLTQADILQALGPSLTVRSDTFRIRAYGESVDPDTGRVRARAWCEAVVQRTPSYVDSSNAADTLPDALNQTNAKYGRRFVVTAFRWLSKEEI